MEAFYEYVVKMLALGGGTSAIAYVVFRFFGKKFVENQFDKQLENHKYKINSLYNRITKIHEKEFEVLPEAWKKLLDAYIILHEIANPFITPTLDDLDKKSKKQLQMFLSNSNLSQADREKVIKQKDKNKTYQSIVLQHRYNLAYKPIREFHDCIYYNSIFLSRDISDSFEKVDKELWQGLEDWQKFQKKNDMYKIVTTVIQIKKNADRGMSEIKELVQKRLRTNDAE